MNFFKYSPLILMAILYISCGEDLVEKGDIAFQKGDFSSAIENWSIAQVRDSSLQSLNSRIALAYLYRGQDIYQRVHNVKAFDGNLTKAIEYLPEMIGGELQKEYLKTLCDVSEAYLNTKAKNENEKTLFIKRATKYLKNARSIDSTSTRADSMLQKIKKDIFQDLLNSGKSYFAKAGKMRNIDYYFTAKHYLEEALEYDDKNAEIFNLLYKIKIKTLPVLDYKDEVAMAITDIKRKEEEVILTVTVKNYLSSPVHLNLDNFRLIDSQGKVYNRDDQMMNVFYADLSLKNTKLDQNNPFTEGVLVFPVEDETKLYSLEYIINHNKVSRKYFP